MGDWRRLARLEELEEHTPLALRVGRMEFLVVRHGRDVSVCADRCPHDGARLSGGVLSGDAIACPRHTARFDVGTGRLLSPPALDDIPCFQVKVEGGEVFVGKPAAPQPEMPAGGAPQVPAGEAGALRHPPRFHGSCFLIVGGGAAGNACAEALRREGFTGRVVILTDEQGLPCYRPVLSKGLLAGATPPGLAFLRTDSFYASAGIELIRGQTLVRVEPEAHAVTCAGGRCFSYEKLLLATGGTPRRLGVPGEDLPGCHYLRSREDALALVDRAAGARRALVVGAGFLGNEAAAALRARGLDVTLVSRGSGGLEETFGARVSARIRALHGEHGVRLLTGIRVKAFQGHASVQRVAMDNGGTLETDLVVVAAGIDPAVSYLHGTRLLQGEAVPVDGGMQTCEPDIFAAGDIALAPYGPDLAPARVEHWVVAERQGFAAARSMLGVQSAFVGPVFFWTELYGLSFAWCGFPGSWDRSAFRGDPEHGSFFAEYFRGERLVAAAASGYEHELAVAHEMFRAGAQAAAAPSILPGFVHT